MHTLSKLMDMLPDAFEDLSKGGRRGGGAPTTLSRGALSFRPPLLAGLPFIFRLTLPPSSTPPAPAALARPSCRQPRAAAAPSALPRRSQASTAL